MHLRNLLWVANIQKQGVSIQHDTVGGAGDDSGNLTGNLNLPKLNESRLVLNGYFSFIRQRKKVLEPSLQ